jgi:uncharacterized RDD family membrane protein YckC
MTQTPQPPPAGWYPDPAGGTGERFWDGEAWSQATRDVKSQPFEHRGESRSVPSPAATQPAGGPYGSAPGGPYGGGHYGHQQAAPAPQYQSQNRLPYGPQVPVQGGYKLGTFWWRALGYIIDSFVIGFVSYFLTADMQNQTSNVLAGYLSRLLESSVDPSIPAPDFPGTLVVDMLVIGIISVLLVAAYRTITVGLMNATLGQKLLGLRVAKLGDESLEPVGWQAAIVRGVAGGVLYQLIGLFAQISVLFTDRKQTIPDLVSKTVVVNTREPVR